MSVAELYLNAAACRYTEADVRRVRSFNCQGVAAALRCRPEWIFDAVRVPVGSHDEKESPRDFFRLISAARIFAVVSAGRSQ
jgi:hypothetical protein